MRTHDSGNPAPASKGRRFRRRAGIGLRIVLAVAFAVTVVQIVAVEAAFANAPNPVSDTTGTATENADGTVSAQVSGTWSWPGQSCEGRYGEGWAVDWWGVSSSSTPSPSFSLTDATEVTAPGTTTTGTVSPVGSIPIPGGTFFHVGQYYAGEVVNSSTTCTDVGSGSSAGSTGSWSASATYPSVADVPSEVCVNMYDEHGSEGKPSGNASDFSPSQDHDNSIQTNQFVPSDGYCVALQVTPPTQTIQGEIYKCVNGAPSTTLLSVGTLSVPAESLQSKNTLAATQVPAGTYTMDASVPYGMEFVACGQTGVTISKTYINSASQSVTVPSGGAGNGKFYAKAAPNGYVEVCKSRANKVSGDFNFWVDGTEITVPAGACSPSIQVPAGPLGIYEVKQTAYKMAGAATIPKDRLLWVNLNAQGVGVQIVPGNVSHETVVKVFNERVPGSLKVCQVAAGSVQVGTEFSFTNSETSQVLEVPAGPAPGGYCDLFHGNFVGHVTITQSIPAGDTVTSIAVAPSDRLVHADPAAGKVTVVIGHGFTEATYTDT